MAYMGNVEQIGDIGGLKKLVKKAGKTLGKVAKVAVPVVAGAGGAILGVKAGQSLVKAVSGSKSSGAKTWPELDPNGVQYATMSADQLRAEAARLDAKIASSKDKSGELRWKRGQIDQYLATAGVAQQAAAVRPAIPPQRAVRRQPALRSGSSGGAAEIAVAAAQTGADPMAILRATTQQAQPTYDTALPEESAPVEPMTAGDSSIPKGVIIALAGGALFLLVRPAKNRR